MKIVFLTLSPSPHIEGNLTALAQNPDVELVVAYETVSQGNRTWGSHFPDCEVINLQSFKLRNMSSLVSTKLWRTLNMLTPDAIVIGSSMWSPNSWIARTFARLKGVPFYIFSEAPNATRTRFFNWLRQRVGMVFFSHASGFLGVTRSVCEELADQYHYTCPSLQFPYHRDLSDFAPPIQNRKPAFPPRLLFVGVLEDRKNVGLLIHALKSVQTPFELHILGGGEQEVMLRKMADDLCTGKIFFHGSAAYEEIPNYMRESDFLILPSKHDGFGMVIIEALTIGLPVIASDGVRAAVEYISPGGNGWLFKNGNTEDLQQKISSALTKLDNWENLSQRATAISATYNVRNTITDFVELAKVGQKARGER